MIFGEIGCMIGTLMSALDSMRETRRLGKIQPPPTLAAERRAEATLKRFLSPEQIAMFEAHNRFIVTGNYTRAQYMLLREKSTNIRLLKNGVPIRCLCFISEKPLPVCDLMLMQKLCLECDERETLKITRDQGPAHPSVPVHVYEADEHIDWGARYCETINWTEVRVDLHNRLWIDEAATIPPDVWAEMRRRDADRFERMMERERQREAQEERAAEMQRYIHHRGPYWI